MNKLSQELIDGIVHCFHPVSERTDLKKILTVSRQFQRAVERVMLAQYTLNKDNVHKFLNLYTGVRLHYLNRVQFLPTFPMSRFEYRLDGCRENVHELAEKDALFTSQIELLFNALKCLEDRIRPEGRAERLHLTIFTPKRAVDDSHCRHRVCVCWRVHLLRSEKLPQLSLIHTLEFKDSSDFRFTDERYREPGSTRYHAPSKIDLRILIDLSSRMRFLERLECRLKTYWPESNTTNFVLNHYTQDWLGPHRDTRHNFSQSLDSITLSSLKHVSLNFHWCFDEDDRDQQEKVPNLVLPLQYDPFSTSLRALSCQLASMILRVTADETLFWPTDGSTPHWPHLKYVDVYFSILKPTGQWYFTGRQDGASLISPPGPEVHKDDYEPVDRDRRWNRSLTDRLNDRLDANNHHAEVRRIQTRVRPINSTIGPLLAAFAKAASNMPALRKAVLWTSLQFATNSVMSDYRELKTQIETSTFGSSLLGWGVAYAKPGDNFQAKGHDHRIARFWDTTGLQDSASRQFWWVTGDWRPEPTLYSLFDQIGQSQHENQAIHHWASDYGYTWVDRKIFNNLIRPV